MTTKILGTGLNGLVGTRVIDLLKNKFSFENLSRSTGTDITDKNQITKIISTSDAKFFLHMAAKTDVDGCELDKALGSGGEAWKINVDATTHIANICRETRKKLIYISTDFVFDGKKATGDSYNETDIPNPINWYGETKYKGENAVTESGVDNIILRIAYPFGFRFTKKNDFVQAIVSRLKNGQPVKAITDHVFVPTFIDDIATALDHVISSTENGIFHVVGNQTLTPFDASLIIASKYNLPSKLIDKNTRSEYFQGRAERPYNLFLRNDRIKQIGVTIRRFEDALDIIKN